MATRVANTTSTDGARVTPYGATSRPGPGASGFETFSWYFFRISGIGLVVLAILHLVLMHVTNDVSSTNYDFIAQRYANPFWRGYDLLLLTLALFHGLNGLRIACDDYIRSRGARLAVQSVLFLTAIGFWLLGSMTIITFQPQPQAAVSPLLRMLFAV
jgi:succinate dehydrogenase / fumarate reductase, membrane anchor subunit